MLEFDRNNYRPWLLPRVLLFSTLSVNPNTGLDEQEAQKRLVRYGPNSLPNSSPSLRSTLSSHELLGTSTASYLLVLILYALNGVNYILLISLVAILIFSRAYFRYGARSRENLTLQDPPPDVLVRRDGQDLLIPADRIVPGDIFYLCPYQRVPCDAAVLISHGLVVDEQLITGRLNFAEKIALTIATVLDPVENIRPPHVAPFVVERGESSNKQTTENEELNRRVPSTYVCAGSLTIQGTAMCLATQTGLNCLLNDEWAFKLPQETRTPLQKKLRQFLRFWNTGLLCFCLLLGCFTSWSASLLLFLVLNFKDANDVLKTILTSGVDLLRQEGIYIRRLRALELLADVSTVVTTGSAAVALDAYNLEAAMVINMDQKCKMQRCISVGPKDVVGSKVQLEQLLIPAVLSCDPSFQFTQSLETYDSHEYHILQYASSSQPTLLTELNETYPALVGEARFNSSTKLSSRAWRASPNAGPVLVAVKGAPEVVLDRCTRICIPSLGESVDSARDIVEITPDVRRLVDEYISSWAREGYQVFAFAYTMVGAPDEMAEAMDKLIFAGCFVFSKVVLPYARYFAEELQSAQVKVILSSGDHQLTAQHIGEVISADQTYYRCTPDFKYQLVKSLKSQGAETVMFLGDPGHDISALYFADIGIVWRHTGRCIDIACESASVFFYARNDGLGDVCYFICEGRQILRNLQVGLSVFFAGKLLLAAVLVYASHDPNTLYLHVLYGEFLVVWAAQTLFTNQDRHIIGFVEPFKIPFKAASIWKIFSRDILINAATILANLAINRNHHQFLALQCALGATLIHRLRYKWNRAWALWCLLLLVYLVAFAGLENHWEEDLGYVVLSNLSIIAISWFAHTLFQEDEANNNNTNPGYM